MKYDTDISVDIEIDDDIILEYIKDKYSPNDFYLKNINK